MERNPLRVLSEKENYKTSLQHSTVFINEYIYRHRKDRKTPIRMFPGLLSESAGAETPLFTFCSAWRSQFPSERGLLLYKREISKGI